MRNTVIDFPTALKMLASIVEEFGPEHRALADTDDNCTYFVLSQCADGFDTLNLRPVCIVGQVFSRLGIMRALVENEVGDGQYATCEPNGDLWSNAAAMGVEFTHEAQVLLRQAQMLQDRGEPWGVAVREGVENTQKWLIQQFQESNPQVFLYHHRILDTMPS